MPHCHRGSSPPLTPKSYVITPSAPVLRPPGVAGARIPGGRGWNLGALTAPAAPPHSERPRRSPALFAALHFAETGAASRRAGCRSRARRRGVATGEAKLNSERVRRRAPDEDKQKSEKSLPFTRAGHSLCFEANLPQSQEHPVCLSFPPLWEQFPGGY